ncbi:MAG: MipA/OmpV family protein [Pseudomonadota bacterium]
MSFRIVIPSQRHDRGYSVHATVLIAAVILIGLGVASFVQAQEGQEGQESHESQEKAVKRSPWMVDLGVAVLANPTFQGSANYDVGPVPYFDVRYFDKKGVKFFANIPRGFGAYLHRAGGDDGPQSGIFVSLAPGFSNRDTGIEGLRTFGLAAEARIGWEVTTKSLVFVASASQALGTGHGGFYVDASAAWRKGFGRGSFFSIGPTVRFGDTTYLDNLYGINEDEALRSGLSAQDTSAGLESVGVQGVLSLPLGGRWRWTNVFRFSELAADPRNSPIVESTSQVFFMSALSRVF